jgi:hypothetical protein
MCGAFLFECHRSRRRRVGRRLSGRADLRQSPRVQRVLLVENYSAGLPIFGRVAGDDAFGEGFDSAKAIRSDKIFSRFAAAHKARVCRSKSHCVRFTSRLTDRVRSCRLTGKRYQGVRPL